ncbi:MAG: hypothetical protein LBK53_02985 [Heliobacteriaceae bacterium]|jgi:hypothetical protein|nr:hypothetical protein [Heliobacteriaceae bacterium]
MLIQKINAGDITFQKTFPKGHFYTPNSNTNYNDSYKNSGTSSEEPDDNCGLEHRYGAVITNKIRLILEGALSPEKPYEKTVDDWKFKITVGKDVTDKDGKITKGLQIWDITKGKRNVQLTMDFNDIDVVKTVVVPDYYDKLTNRTSRKAFYPEKPIKNQDVKEFIYAGLDKLCDGGLKGGHVGMVLHNILRVLEDKGVLSPKQPYEKTVDDWKFKITVLSEIRGETGTLNAGMQIWDITKGEKNVSLIIDVSSLKNLNYIQSVIVPDYYNKWTHQTSDRREFLFYPKRPIEDDDVKEFVDKCLDKLYESLSHSTP